MKTIHTIYLLEMCTGQRESAILLGIQFVIMSYNLAVKFNSFSLLKKSCNEDESAVNPYNLMNKNCTCQIILLLPF